MREPPVLGVVGWSPRGPRAVVRARRLADFQRLAGDLDQADHLAGHAAAHGLMNGFESVAFAHVDDVDDPASVVAVVERLATARLPLAAVVAPGVVALEAFAERCHGLLPDALVWVDAPDDGDPPFGARHVRPPVRAATPGRPSAQVLPGSCVVAPLGVGLVTTMKGLVEVAPPGLTDDELVELRERGVDTLVPVGPRCACGLFGGPVRRPPPPAPSDPPADPIAAALSEALQPLAHGQAPGPGLHAALERAATRVLQGFVASGAITGFGVRCDPSAAVGGNPVVEVAVRTPQRVRQVVVRLSQA